MNTLKNRGLKKLQIFRWVTIMLFVAVIMAVTGSIAGAQSASTTDTAGISFHDIPASVKGTVQRSNTITARLNPNT